MTAARLHTRRISRPVSRAVAKSDSVISTGIVAVYGAGTDVGSVSILDDSGNGNHLRHGGATAAASGINFAAGSTTAVEYRNGEPSSQLQPDAFSMFATVRVDVASGMLFGVGLVPTNMSIRMFHAGSLLFVRVSINGTVESQATISYTLGSTINLFARFDGSTLLIRDLTNDRTDSLSVSGVINKPGSAAPFRLGFVSGGSGSQLLDGNIRDFVFWNRALSDSEVDQIIAGWRPTPVSRGAIPVYHIIGQSNLSGESADADLLSDSQKASLKNPRNLIAGVKLANTNGWTSPQFGIRSNNTELGPDTSFAGSLPAGSAVYSHGISSTNLHTQWASGGTAWNAWVAGYAAAKAELEALGYTPSVEGYVFVQGEADSGTEANANAYQANLTQFIADVRAEYGNKPFVISRLSQIMIDNGQYPFGTITQAAQDAVAAADSTVGVVNTDDLSLEVGEPNHFDAPSAILNGQRLAAEMVRRITALAT